MDQYLQKTLKSAISCVGVGLHSGLKVKMRFHPADPNTGIVFRRTDDEAKNSLIPAHHDFVVDTRLCTCVGLTNGIRVSTIEHLMAAIHAKGINNMIIDVDAPEVAVMDGSAAPFLFLFDCAGTKTQKTPLQALRILKKVSVKDNEKEASLYPAPSGLHMHFEIDFPSKAIGVQKADLDMNATNFKNMFSRARTFGFLKDIEALRAMGLARGGSMDNAVLVDGDAVLNKEGLRYADEFVRHKMLDAVGDLYMAGKPIIGRFTGIKSGHTQTNALLSALFADKDAFETVDLTAFHADDIAQSA